MSASDLPDIRHRSSLEMARVLVTYLNDVEAIRRAIRLEFDQVPCEKTILDLRAEYLVSIQQRDEEAYKPFYGYYPDEERARAERASKRFLAALELERQNSAALRSTFLSRPALVNDQWDREMRT